MFAEWKDRRAHLLNRGERQLHLALDPGTAKDARRGLLNHLVQQCCLADAGLAVDNERAAVAVAGGLHQPLEGCLGSALPAKQLHLPQHATGVANQGFPGCERPSPHEHDRRPQLKSHGGIGVIQTTTTEQRVAIAREYVDRVFNGHDGELARDYFSPMSTFHALTVGTLSGIDAVVPVVAGLIDALSDIHAEVQDVIASDDLVALRQVVTARHTGTLLGMPATGGPAAVGRRRHLPHRDAGKITEQWAFEDFAAILSQLGGVKLPWAW